MVKVVSSIGQGVVNLDQHPGCPRPGGWLSTARRLAVHRVHSRRSRTTRRTCIPRRRATRALRFSGPLSPGRTGRGAPPGRYRTRACARWRPFRHKRRADRPRSRSSRRWAWRDRRKSPRPGRGRGPGRPDDGEIPIVGRELFSLRRGLRLQRWRQEPPSLYGRAGGFGGGGLSLNWQKVGRRLLRCGGMHADRRHSFEELP